MTTTSKRSSNHHDWLVVALGNPGKRYLATRHNVGRMVLDAAYPDLSWADNEYAQSDEAYVAFSTGVRIIFAKPKTYMNESGLSARWYVHKHHIKPEAIIVMHDDIDLPLGTFRISYDRGDGGHNGVKSIIASLGTKRFVRLRIGVSYPQEGKIDLIKPDVLGSFPESDRRIIREKGEHARLCIETIIGHGVQYAMNRLNTK